jgi:hypothetical protein
MNLQQENKEEKLQCEALRISNNGGKTVTTGSYYEGTNE